MSTETNAITLEIATPDALVKHAATELSAPIDRAAVLFAPFQKPFADAAELLIQEPGATGATAARVLRLKLVKARTAISKTKDAAKADVKIVGQVIDWYHRKGAEQCEQAEARLLEIEKAEERAESERKEKIRRERHESLAAVGVDGTFYQLGNMPDCAFDQLIGSATLAHQTRLERETKAREDARIAAEKAAAEQRAREAAEAIERERVRVENERLKREAAEREEAAKLERERVETERIAEQQRQAADLDRRRKLHHDRKQLLAQYITSAEMVAIPPFMFSDASDAEFAAVVAEKQSAALERERIAKEAAEREAAAKIERDRLAAEKAEADRAASIEREARAKLESEAKSRRDAEEARQREETDRAARAAAAPDREKLKVFAELVRTLEVPEMSTASGKTAAREIAAYIETLAREIESLASKMIAVKGGAK